MLKMQRHHAQNAEKSCSKRREVMRKMQKRHAQNAEKRHAQNAKRKIIIGELQSYAVPVAVAQTLFSSSSERVNCVLL